MRIRIDGMALVGLALLALFGFYIVRNWAGGGASAVPVAAADGVPEVVAVPLPDPAAGGQSAAAAGDSTAFALPYTDYVLTQGLHGESYGHSAIDLAAGDGETIHSPINGTVTQRYMDQWGNTVIVIENDTFVVTMFHGNYTAGVGEAVALGQPVGTESNIGYTLDAYGNLCGAGSSCGYHTHLNVFDRRVGTNVNPFDLLN